MTNLIELYTALKELKRQKADAIEKQLFEKAAQLRAEENQQAEKMEEFLKSSLDAAIYGFVVGDALGVPVEFTSREERDRDPVNEMRAFGTWNQPAGTWSDDSSLMLCLYDVLKEHPRNLRTDLLAYNFVRWYEKGYRTAHGKLFDIGITTRIALEKLQKGVDPELAGESNEQSNGNGSLMRILPLAFYTMGEPEENLLQLCHRVSSLTHAHPRSVLACFIYTLYIQYLLMSHDKGKAYDQLCTTFNKLSLPENIQNERAYFERVLGGKLHEYKRDTIMSTGYVVHSLESCIWCFLTTEDYKKAVLDSVNLGGDTDTIAALTGGLAGLYYGKTDIPKEWLEKVGEV